MYIDLLHFLPNLTRSNYAKNVPSRNTLSGMGRIRISMYVLYMRPGRLNERRMCQRIFLGVKCHLFNRNVLTDI